MTDMKDEITPESTYLNRRNFLRAGIIGAGAVGAGTLYRLFGPDQAERVVVPRGDELNSRAMEGLGEALTPYEDITSYNNFYEFSTSKHGVARASRDWITRPWTLEVGGLVGKPKVYGIDELLAFPQEDRIYRFRCVEAWSMVIPWAGFELRRLIELAEPLQNAKYVAFQSFYDAGIMLSSRAAGIDFPYVEGLRLDEAMHPLTILATGLYGKAMPNQNGAPIRLVVPWKYGFKSIKSVVKITLTEEEPPTTWSTATPSEYGFYSNVNPEVDHPRWSQKTERRIGELKMRETLMFNGYEDDVGHLYAGMDLKRSV
jgi:methionine sulfoxide reductase catalytic subunit